MNNNIEEDIEILKNLKEQVSTTYYCNHYSQIDKAIENILADRERLENKANAYDSLVEKMKENLRDRELIKECATVSDREHLNGEIFALQELLDTVEEKK